MNFRTKTARESKVINKSAKETQGPDVPSARWPSGSTDEETEHVQRACTRDNGARVLAAKKKILKIILVFFIL